MSLLTRHLDDVDETYFQHMRHAGSFAVTLFGAALACAVHAVLPFAFEKTGSACIRRLYERMVTHRHELTPGKDRPSRRSTVEAATGA